MERVVANVTAGARRVRRGGRDWLVAPMTLLVEGVLHGSQGPLFYPAPEIAAGAAAWDRVPITLGHPADPTTNAPVPASAEGVLARLGLGVVRRPRMDGDRLRAEGWFDAARVRRLEPSLYRALAAGEPVELSTGLFTENEPAGPGASHKGRPYGHVARRHAPDHLAVLVGRAGACSVADGCGVLVNAGGPDARALAAAGAWLSKNGLMPGYGQVFVKGAEVWYVGGDGDEDGFGKLVQEKLGAVEGVAKVTYEAEAFPPAGAGWSQVYPREKAHNADADAGMLGRMRRWFHEWLTGNAEKGDGQPSDELDVTPEKACEILKDGEVHGKELTEAQRGMFGAKCGERDGKADNAAEGAMNREAAIVWLVANCDCWKDGRAALEQLPDDRLEKLRAGALRAREAEEVANAAREGLVVNGQKYAWDAQKKQLAADPAQPAAPAPAPAPAANAARPPATMREWLAQAPPEGRRVWDRLVENDRRHHEALADRLVANAASPEAAQAARAAYLKMDPRDLEAVLAAMPPPAEPAAGPAAAPFYWGAGGGPPAANARDDSQNLLPEFPPAFGDAAAPAAARA